VSKKLKLQDVIYERPRLRSFEYIEYRFQSFYCVLTIHDLLSNERLSNEVLSMFLLSKCHFIELSFIEGILLSNSFLKMRGCRGRQPPDKSQGNLKRGCRGRQPPESNQVVPLQGFKEQLPKIQGAWGWKPLFMEKRPWKEG
jgi:hypothetical protein